MAEQQFSSSANSLFPTIRATNVMNYGDRKIFESVLSGDIHNPSVPSSSTLSSMKELNWFMQRANNEVNGESLDPAIKKMYEAESKYLVAGMNAITNNDTLRTKMGSDFNAVIKVAGIIRDKHAEDQLDYLLREYIPPTESLRIRNVER